MSKRAPKGAKDSPARPLVKARNERKAAEVDMQALQNRIALLKKEEQRAHHRIKETRNRASQIMKIREDNLHLKKQLAAADPGKYNADVRRRQVQDRFSAARSAAQPAGLPVASRDVRFGCGGTVSFESLPSEF